MAVRRMLSKAVIDTDGFMEMPISAQCLYFHLLLASDDDGFVVSPKKLLRQLGASEDDMRILIAKDYVYAFESGIVVIRHWFVHNRIRRDRYTPTVCAEKSILRLDDKMIYQLMPLDANTSGNQVATIGFQSGNQAVTDGFQADNQADTQAATDGSQAGNQWLPKDRISKDRGEEATATPFDEIIALYHCICKDLRPAKVLTPQRKQAIRELYSLLGGSMEAVRKYFQKCASTPFLCGKNRDSWKADLDFLLAPSKYANIIEGKYDAWRNTNERNGACGRYSGKAKEQISSFAAECDAFEQQQDLPREL